MSADAPVRKGRFSPKVVTANDLRLGDAVWLTADNRWSRDISEAEFLEEDARAQERLQFGASQKLLVVGVYLADARLGVDGHPVPTHFREEFRARGPSNYPHGKQADLQAN